MLAEMITSTSMAKTADPIDIASFFRTAIKKLRELRRSNDRQRSLCKDMISEMKARVPAKAIQNIDSLRKTYELAEEELQVMRKTLQEAEQKAAKARRTQVERRGKREELKALAQLALRHLGKTCPVCGQKHDIESTRQRLEELATAPTEEVMTIDDRALKIAAELEQQEKTCIDAKAKLSEVEKIEREYRSWVSTRDSRLKEMGIHFKQDAEILENLGALDANLENKKKKLADL